MIRNTTGLSRPDIFKVVNQYIGVNAGYLGDFSYQTHHDFYLEYCGLESINPYDYEGTTRERFITILSEQLPHIQAKILEGILAKYPVDSNELRTQERFNEIRSIIERLKRGAVVSNPSPQITSDVVETAINDAEILIKNNRATSGIDRIHTALHGYLKAVCKDSGIPTENDPTITQLFKQIKSHHPAFADMGPQSDAITKMLRSASAILDTLSPIRNRGSVAHPNEKLLNQSEAVLFINITRSLLHYLDMKITDYSSGSQDTSRQDAIDDIPF
jgi:hypothetical protein